MKGINLILILLQNSRGLTYNELSKLASNHINTVSREVTFLEEKGLIEIGQKKGKMKRGRRWHNIIYPSSELERMSKNQLVRLLRELYDEGWRQNR